MAGKADRKALKQQALLSLEQSRSGMRIGVSQAREHLSPAHLLKSSFQKHQLPYIIGAAVGGLVLSKLLFSGKNQISRDTLVKSARKRSLTGFVFSGIWGMAREPLLALAAQQLMPVAMKYLSKFQNNDLKSPSSKPFRTHESDA